MGKSGSGKTTMLSLLAGLSRPSAGEIYFDGAPLSKRDADHYRLCDAAVIYQAYNLFPLLTVLENVCYPMELQHQPKAKLLARAREMLRKVGLNEGYERRYPTMLSGGEQQRVAVARALAGDARLILADEPTGNLDGENSEIVVNLLTQLAHEQDKCLIIVTHDPSVAERCDEQLRMRDGRLESEA